jgi:hypothetical protein
MATNPPAIKDKTLVTKQAMYDYRHFRINALVDLTAGQVRDWDLVTLLGADAAKYDMDKNEVQIFVLDTDPASPTFEFYIDANAVATLGMKEDGTIRIINQHTDTLKFWIRFIVHLKQV